MTDLAELTIDQSSEDGFYAMIDGDLGFAPNFVQWPDGTMLQRAERETYDYPVRGYYWFNTRREALRFFGTHDPSIDTTLAEPTQVMIASSNEAASMGPIPPDNDPNDDDQGILEKPDPYIPYNKPGCFTDGSVDPGNPPAEADDVELEDPNMRPPDFA